MEIKLRIILIFSAFIPIRDIIEELILKIFFITLCNRNNLIPENNLKLNFINHTFT
jgi:hypothetical protein